MFIELGPVQARVFATAIHFYPSLIFLGKAAAYHNGAPLPAPSLAYKY
jgi:hypothetical protein